MNPPEAFVRLYELYFGQTASQAYLTNYAEPALRGLRVNTLRSGQPLPARALARPILWAKEGYYIDPQDGFGKDPLHAAGAYYLQEPSAMAPASALAAKPGEQILDLCAAPGGKTTQIAAHMQGEGLLVANEIDRERCLALAQNVERMGLFTTLVTQLPPSEIAEVYPHFFDGVLVDAPCSGEGLFRREEAAILQWSEAYLAQCADLQLEILRAAVRTLKPGGRLVYSTCTINPLENEVTCLRLLANYPDLELIDTALPGTTPGLSIEALTRIARQWPLLHAALTTLDMVAGAKKQELAPTALSRTRRILPHSGTGEGHFIATFVYRPSALPTTKSSYQRDRQTRTRKDNRMHVPPDWEQAWRQHAQAVLTATAEQRINRAPRSVREGGGQVLFATATGQAPVPVRGVLRNGVALLTRPHQHIALAHALAMTLTTSDVRCSLSLPYGDERILGYLQGESITAPDTPDGIVHVSVAGYPLGWGKAVKGVVKNHYPKGLRRRYTFALPERTPFGSE